MSRSGWDHTVDIEGIHETVNRAVSEAMEGLHATLESLSDLPFGVPGAHHGWSGDREWSTATAEAPTAPQSRWKTDETSAILQALERGDISVDEAMERLGEKPR